MFKKILKKGQRGVNQDRILCKDLWICSQKVVLLGIADGVSRRETILEDEIASSIAIDCINRMPEIYSSLMDLRNHCLQAMKDSNSIINSEILKHPEKEKIATTMTLALIHQYIVRSLHIGDTRFYHIRQPMVRQMTCDHNLTGDQYVKDRSRIKMNNLRLLYQGGLRWTD